MASKCSVIVSFLCLQLYPAIDAIKYAGRVTENIKDCQGKEEASLSKFFDTTHLESDWDDEGNLVLNGYVIFLADIDPNQNVQLSAKTFKKVGTKWISAPDLERKDICASYMDPKEVWYATAKHFVGDQRLCPPKKGTRFEFHNTPFRLEFNLPRGLEGEYMASLDLKTKEAEICFVGYGINDRI